MPESLWRKTWVKTIAVVLIAIGYKRFREPLWRRIFAATIMIVFMVVGMVFGVVAGGAIVDYIWSAQVNFPTNRTGGSGTSKLLKLSVVAAGMLAGMLLGTWLGGWLLRFTGLVSVEWVDYYLGKRRSDRDR